MSRVTKLARSRRCWLLILFGSLAPVRFLLTATGRRFFSLKSYIPSQVVVVVVPSTKNVTTTAITTKSPDAEYLCDKCKVATVGNHFSCVQRIKRYMAGNLSLEEAQTIVSGEYSDCSVCDPETCKITVEEEIPYEKSGNSKFENMTLYKQNPPAIVNREQTQDNTNGTIIEGMTLNACYKKANAMHIRARTNDHRKWSIPLLASVVATPKRVETVDASSSLDDLYWTAHFSLCHITWYMPRRQRKWMSRWSNPSESTWRCDGKAAQVVSQGCPHAMGISIRCPQRQHEMVTNITIYNYTYYVRDHIQCAQEHPLRVPTRGVIGQPLVVSAVIVYQMDLHRALEWVAYHRLLGIDHFYLYMMDDDDNKSWWPDLDYVTYVPWNLNPNMLGNINIFLFQTAAQVDSIHRGRALGLDWIVFNDMDEYIVLPSSNSSNSTTGIHSYLKSVDRQVQAGIEGQTASVGGSRGHQEWILDYTYRTEATYGHRRCKSFVRPTHVDYYAIHWITMATGSIYKPKNPWRELLFYHYKNAHRGVFLRELANRTVVQDTTLRDKYLVPVKDNVNSILRWRDQ